MEPHELYIKSREEAIKQKQVFHFTKFDVLKIILNSEKLRLSSLMNINDPKEIKYLDRMWERKIFIISFTGQITPYFWEEYAKSPEEGVCIEFRDLFSSELVVCSEEGYMCEHCERTDHSYLSNDHSKDWGVRSLDFLKVYYFINPEENRIIDDSFVEFYKGLMDIEDLIRESGSINGQGFVKEKKWENEREFRIRVAMRPKGRESKLSLYNVKPIIINPPFHHVYIDISKYDYSKIVVWIKEKFKRKDDLLDLQSIYKFQVKCIE